MVQLQPSPWKFYCPLFYLVRNPNSVGPRVCIYNFKIISRCKFLSRAFSFHFFFFNFAIFHLKLHISLNGRLKQKTNPKNNIYGLSKRVCVHCVGIVKYLRKHSVNDFVAMDFGYSTFLCGIILLNVFVRLWMRQCCIRY